MVNIHSEAYLNQFPARRGRIRQQSDREIKETGFPMYVPYF